MKERGSGAVSLKDGATGGQVTVQNSEVREISKDQYEANRRLSGQDPQAEAKAKAAEEEQAAARAAEQRAAEQRAAAKQAEDARAAEARAAAKQADASAAEAKAKAAEGDVALTAAAVGTAAAKHAQSAQQLRADLIASKDQVDRSLASLTDLTDPNQTDLTAAYKRFNEQLNRMNQQSQKVKVEADQMRQARDAYFAKWDARLAATDNPTIRAEAESKRARLRAGQEKIAADAARAREAFQPFIIDLEDTRKFVGTDVSKESVSVLGPTVKKAQQDGAVLKDRLDVLIADLDAIEGKPTTKPSSPAAP
jgi:colicin import membrane protein